MIITKQFEKSPTTKTTMEIPAGAIFTGKVGVVEGTFLKAYRVIVYLEDPTTTWPLNSSMIVNNYKEWDAELILKEKK